MENSTFTHHPLFFLVVLQIILLSFFASGLHGGIMPVRQDNNREFITKIPYRFTQPEAPPDPKGDILWGEECGAPGETNDLLDCVDKESFGYCLQGRCRQTGMRFYNKCQCR